MLANRAKQLTDTQTDSLPYSLTVSASSPPAGFVSFVDGMKDATGDPTGPWAVSYLCEGAGDEWEVGFGTLTDGTPDEVSRDTILGSSNGGAAVNWGSGTRTIVISLVAEQLDSLLRLATFGLIERTAANAYAIVPVTAAGKAIIDDADNVAQRVTLGSGTAGDAVFVSVSAATARAAIASGVFGDQMFLTADQAAAIALLNITNVNNKGLLDAVFEYVDETQVRLSRRSGSDIRIEIDDVVLKQSGSLTFTLPTDLDAGSEASSTIYYCYVANNSGAMLQKISISAPVIDPANKVGYHPTSTTWRCVGSFRNNASSHILRFRTNGRWIRFTSKDVAHFHDFGAASVPTAWTSQVLAIPVGSRAVSILVDYRGGGTRFCFSSSDVTGSLSTASDFNMIGDSNMIGVLAELSLAPDNDSVSGVFELPIADPSAPAIKWGIARLAWFGNFVCRDAEIRVVAYYDPHLPA